MKNKSIWLMGVGVIVVVAVVSAIVVVVLNANKTAAPQTDNSKTATYNPPKACEVLTSAIAQKISSGATSGQESPSQDTPSVSVSSCSYYDSSAKVSVGLLVRGAKDTSGAQTNRAQFAGIPATGQSVSGYGDAAYWDTSFGQLNILKHGNWYILTDGGVAPTSHKLDDTKKLADLIINKL